MGAVSGWELGLQLSLTQSAVAGAAGVRPVLFRPPYASTPDTISVEALDGFRTVAERGYLIALSDYDSKDWKRDGVDAIIERATPPADAGGVILFHDGGGDRTPNRRGPRPAPDLAATTGLPIRNDVVVRRPARRTPSNPKRNRPNESKVGCCDRRRGPAPSWPRR